MEPNLISSFGQRDKTMRPENLHPQLIYDHVGFPSSSLMLVLTICSYLVINSSLVFHFPGSGAPADKIKEPAQVIVSKPIT